MNKLLALCFFLLNLPQCYTQELQSGDVLLMSFNCYECKIIESETNSSFSHSGVVFRDKNNQLFVMQALGNINFVSITKFLSNKRPQTNVQVYRPKQFHSFNTSESQVLSNEMIELFNRDFLGLKFDSLFLWNNVDENGNELLYCSEFVAKFLDRFLDRPSVPYPLSFKKNFHYWNTYFKGNIPEGELGNSPGSFAKDERFEFLRSL